MSVQEIKVKFGKSKRTDFLILITLTKNKDIEEYYENMQSCFVWSPGNLVIGPKERVDDPGDKFDTVAAKIAKIDSMPSSDSLSSSTTPSISSSSLESHSEKSPIEKLYESMCDYIAGKPFDESLIDKVLIPHICREITDGSKADWS